jgi:HlyD family secretion protein
VRTGLTILADGIVAAGQPPLVLAFEASGKLLDVHVQAGDRVQAGDPLATLDDSGLQEGLTNASLQVRQAENGLAQAELTLADLVNWVPDEAAVAAAQANLEAAEARYERALSQDATAGYSVTPAKISLDQAQQALVDAQEAYDNAWDEARDWETFYEERICYEGQGGMVPCTGPRWKDRIEAEREGTARSLKAAQDNLTLAQANYKVALAGLSDSAALEAEAALLSAQQTLEQATSGPKESEVAAAQLRVEQAELALDQSLFAEEQAENALARAQLVAPESGRVVSVDAAVGAMVGPGTPIATLLDAGQLEFHTTNVSERDLTQVRAGQSAEVTLKAYPNDPLDATVVRIGLQPGAPVGDAATFPVILVLAETDLDLRPGMTGRVEIYGGE